MTLRQSEMGGSTLRKKSSLARIQGAFRRTSTSRDGSSSTSPNPTSAVGSPRIGPSGTPLGVISTSAASAANAAEKRASVTNLATAYPTTQGGGVNGKHEVGYASTVGVGGNGTVNGGSILAQAEREIA